MSSSSSLLKAVMSKRPDSVRRLLESRQVQRPDGVSSALVAAAGTDCLEIVKLLLQQSGVSTEYRDESGITALTALCSTGSSVELMSLLLDFGANPNFPNSFGHTPLLLATRRNKFEFATLLIKRGADPNAKEPKFEWTPLVAAVADSSGRMVQLLLSAGANVDELSRDGTALARAASLGNSVCVQQLLSHGADVNLCASDNFGPLAFASEKGYVECVRILLEVGADVNQKTNEGRTPLILASLNRQESTVQLLLSFNADPNCQERRFSWTPLITAVYADSSAVVDLLLAHSRTDVDLVGRDGTALAVAANFGNVKMINKLIDKGGADVNKEDQEKYTPLMWAALNGHTEAVDVLLRAGADAARLNSEGNPALLLCACNGHPDTLRSLLRAKLPSWQMRNFAEKALEVFNSSVEESGIDRSIASRIVQMLQSVPAPAPATAPATVSSEINTNRFGSSSSSSHGGNGGNNNLTPASSNEGALHGFSISLAQSVARSSSGNHYGSVRGVVVRAVSSNPVLPREFLTRNDLSNKLQFINHGNFGWVYKTQKSNGQWIVLKLVSMASRDGWEDRMRLSESHVREITLMKELNHKNIVKFINCEVVNNFLVICMEFIDGKNLRQLRWERSGFTQSEIVNFITQICHGLSYMHHKKICHRDIKCDNLVFQRSTGIVKMIDFGLSKRIHQADTLHTPVGTPFWTAPEVLLSVSSGSGNRKYDPLSADIYSLGCTLHEMVTGRAPLVDICTNMLQLLNYHYANRLDPLPTVEMNSKVSTPLVRLFLTCTNKSPRRRPTVDEVLTDVAINVDRERD